MGSLSGQVPSDEESGGINRINQDFQSDEEEQQVKFQKKWLGWLSSFSGPAAIGIAVYQRSKNIHNKNAKGLLHASTILMVLGFIFSLTLWILAHLIHGREGFGKRLKHGVVFITVLVVMPVILVVVGFF